MIDVRDAELSGEISGGADEGKISPALDFLTGHGDGPGGGLGMKAGASTNSR